MSGRPRKRFGQHFLHDPRVIARIVDTLDPRPGERLVEIGPGRGALTYPVLARAGRLDVVEIDRDLAEALRRTPAAAGELVVHEADALQFDFTALVHRTRRLRLFGNLPYNISTPLLFRLASQFAAIDDMLFMLQKEVVDRMTATPGNKTYGRLTVMLAVVARMDKLFTIGPGAFAPPPRVDSAIVRITPLPAPVVTGAVRDRFAQLVSLAFSQRRKTLRNALRAMATAQEIADAGLDPGQRPETVDPAGFAALAHSLSVKP